MDGDFPTSRRSPATSRVEHFAKFLKSTSVGELTNSPRGPGNPHPPYCCKIFWVRFMLVENTVTFKSFFATTCQEIWVTHCGSFQVSPLVENSGVLSAVVLLCHLLAGIG